MGRCPASTQGPKNLALWSRFPHHELANLHLQSLPPHYHQRLGLYFCSSPVAFDSSLRCCLLCNYGFRHICGEDKVKGPVHHRQFLSGHRWVHYSPHQHPGRCFVCGHDHSHLRSLFGHRDRLELACKQRFGSDQTGDCERDATFYRESRSSSGNTIVPAHLGPEVFHWPRRGTAFCYSCPLHSLMNSLWIRPRAISLGTLSS